MLNDAMDTNVPLAYEMACRTPKSMFSANSCVAVLTLHTMCQGIIACKDIAQSCRPFKQFAEEQTKHQKPYSRPSTLNICVERPAIAKSCGLACRCPH
jgi:hypothetical protein